MRLSKSKILAIISGLILLFFITLAYFNNHIFLDKIVLCSVIIGMLFLIKTINTNNNREESSNRKNYSDLT